MLGRQEEALSDFTLGSQYGNEVAKIASIKENPIAKLCGTVVQEVMKQYQVPASND
ncbi:hypothetical protein HMI54_006360 [Coelomomyces lativittatus]|nr:hypothetical protein HMI56_006980 [Coelomomyces lativittatus]KAJ1517263.1 hypothetical protein HMI54_006360 [Coelomomyces lativittatus]KAJ1517995.1 hypothetical protein HMI55_004153 [Coelomomyces lativittatus]